MNNEGIIRTSYISVNLGVNGENPFGIQGGGALAAALRLSSSPTSEMNFTQRNCG